MVKPFTFAILTSLLVACAASEIDTRFSNIEPILIETYEYPVKVRTIKIDDQTYDVESMDGRSIAFTGINEPLLMKERYRNAAFDVMQDLIGSDKQLKIVSEHSNTGAVVLYMRFKVENK